MQILEFETSDGMALQLAYFEPSNANAPVVLCTHGVANSFTNTPLWKVAHRIHAQGYGIAIMNNRGHDWVSMNPTDRRWTGAAYERMEDSALDFQAAIGRLKQQGHRSLIIAGHSLGGLKAAYTQSFFPDEAVVGLAMFSSPRLPDDKDWDWPWHEKNMAQCRTLIDKDQGNELLHFDMPTNTPALRGLMSASTYVNKYGPDAVTTTLRFADKIRVPVFLIAGSEEKPQLSFSVDLEPALVNAPSVKRIAIEGADHVYSGRHDAVAEAFVSWLSETPWPGR